MRVLINVIPPYKQGGVANYYRVLKKYWSEDVIYNYVGGRRGIPGAIILFYDLVKFTLRCLHAKPDIVVLNPSLRKNALRREALFLRISHWLNIKTLVFFRGWGKDQERTITQNPASFRKTFNRADGFLVLASEFKEKLVAWGISKPIHLTVTKVDDEFVEDFKLNKKQHKANLLFLARVEEYKGIFIAIKTFEKIIHKLPYATLTIAGDGGALGDAKKYVKDHHIPNIEFKGRIRDDAVIRAFEKAGIYILPTKAEGMPSSVLEAMAFGLPVLTRPVGGLNDFFENGNMGYLIESLDPKEFSEKALEILTNPDKIQSMGAYNYHYAKKNFMASKVAEKLEKMFQKFLKATLCSY